MRSLPNQDVRRTASHALFAGARQTGPISVDWDIAGNCESPKGVELHGRKYRDRHHGSTAPAFVSMSVRCRRCATCLRARSRRWRYRAETEINQASRTWFGTLTLSPESHFHTGCVAASRNALRSVNFARLGADDQFTERHRVISDEITRYLKRVRKASGAPFRYLLVAEAHKSGLPHYHILLHEYGLKVTHRVLSSQWLLGFEKWRLVHDKGAAGYVCKYLTKSALARVRASKRYGVDDLSPSETCNLDHQQTLLTGPVL